MAKKDKNDYSIYRKLLSLNFAYTWDVYTDNKQVNSVLSKLSKNGKGNIGIPDMLYVNENERLLIIIEVKPTISLHISQIGKEDPEKFAVDGIRFYMSGFKSTSLASDKLKEYFSVWRIVGIAVSGDIFDPYNHRLSTFTLNEEDITEQKGIVDFLDEKDYIALFDNFNEEKIIDGVSSSSKKINKWLRSVDSQKRPILLSALMICLFEEKGLQNDFRNGYNSWSTKTIIENIPSTVTSILSAENIPIDKINLIRTELGFLGHDQDLNNSDILKDILNELRDYIIPLFRKKSNYDIIGRFYEEFLRYAGVANVKKGIVLTPRHVTTLFTDLLDIRLNDVFLDPACGTGAFLIAAMNVLIEKIRLSDVPDKESLISNIKNKQLIGFEKNATMYSLAISNMMFRGDGKSHIFYTDYFSDTAEEEVAKLSKNGIVPTIGFINPPYGGKDNKDNPTKKEIQFLTRMLSHVSRYGVIIAPLSTFFKEDDIRNSILTKNTLKYVINMPPDLFMPNAAANTAIAVFETNKPHGNQEVVFYDLKDDGFVLSKARGRTDLFNKWSKIKTDMLTKITNPMQYEDKLSLVKTKISNNDEWVIQAHSKTNYENFTSASFISVMKDYLVYKARKSLDILDSDINELTLGEMIINFYGIDNQKVVYGYIEEKVDMKDWEECSLLDYFDMQTGKYYPATSFHDGNTPLISASETLNGIMSFTDIEPSFSGNVITIGKIGMSMFYQDGPCCITCDVTALVPRQYMDIYIAMFIIAVTSQENYKWSYGRQIRLNDSQKLKVMLPIKKDENGKKTTIVSPVSSKIVFCPDWEYMTEYIKSLPYSSYL